MALLSRLYRQWRRRYMWRPEIDVRDGQTAATLSTTQPN